MTSRTILAALVLTAAPLIATAATGPGPSFDCGKASTPVEKAICASPALSRLDREMAVQYAATAATTRTPVTLKVEQRDFLAQRSRRDDGEPAKTVQIDTLTALYKSRITALAEQAAEVRKAGAASIPQAALKTRCAIIAVTPCKVEAAGKVAGSDAWGGLFYQLQGPTSDDEWSRGVVVLKPGAGGVLTPLMWNFRGDIPATPAIVQSPDGPLLVLPSTHAGTGRFNAELLFRPVSGGWRDLDIDAWRPAFDKGLAPGIGVWKGVPYDWKSLTLMTGLWQDSDANCCPTGGSAEARLTVRGDQLALKSMRVDRTPPKDE